MKHNPKKKRWFDKEQSLFSNTIKKHSDNLKAKYDADGFEILPEDEYSSSGWDLDRKLLNKDSPKNKKERYEANKKEYGDVYSNYEKTGEWTGFRQQQLTYKYVQQMANALSAKNNIKIEVGDRWEVDLISKKLIYNPASLIYGTKAELLATLMHEIGKIRYVTHPSLLTSKYLKKYKTPALEVLGVYEDLRTDFLMLQVYESASEIYESIIPTIEEQVKRYMKVGEAFRELLHLIPLRRFEKIIDEYCEHEKTKVVNPKNPFLRQELHKVFGTSDLDAVQLGLSVIESKSKTVGTIYEWCGEMLSAMYNLDPQGYIEFENIKDKIKKTHYTIEKSKPKIDSQDLVKYLDVATYPVVEDLLKSANDNNEVIQKAFPQMSAEMMEMIMNDIHSSFNMEFSSGSRELKGITRIGGKNDDRTPPEWNKGEYKPLKDSVSMEIKALVRRLTFLRREELTVRYSGDQKRGKMNAKKLYKHSVGSNRLFKQKMENTDTIRSFAFSILLDVSGSMQGTRILHTTRALIILIEVFKQLQIPFEVTTFSNGAKNIKSFYQNMDKDIERKIGGLVRHGNGGTNLEAGLEMLKIDTQPEKNKIVIVLTDGGVGYPKEFDEEFFLPWQKKGIKSIGVGIDCERQMAELCLGNTRMLKSATELPQEFSKLLKELIKR